MSHPKLTMRDIRRHPATITDPDAVQPGLEVALCHLIQPPNRSERRNQALLSLVSPAKDSTASARERMKQGYRHTPVWGIVVNEVATVSWVNRDNPVHNHPYASLWVTQSSHDSTLEEKLRDPAPSMDELRARVDALPAVSYENTLGEIMHAYEAIHHFDTLGLAPNPDGLDYFSVDLSQLK